MLSFKDGDAIARIISGKYKDKVIFVDTTEKVPGAKYNKIDLKGNQLQQILDPDKRSVIYIGGASGAGKSTYAAEIVKVFKKLFKKKDVYFFSRTDVRDDPAYTKLKPIQVKIDQKLVDDPILVEDIEKGSMIVMDDIGTIHDKYEKEAVMKLVEDILEVGRKMKLYLILTSHLINPTNKQFARTILNELTSLTFFPKSGSYQIAYVLKNYWGLDKKQIDEILKLPSRWVTITRGFPTIIMYEHGCYII